MNWTIGLFSEIVVIFVALMIRFQLAGPISGIFLKVEYECQWWPRERLLRKTPEWGLQVSEGSFQVKNVSERPLRSLRGLSKGYFPGTSLTVHSVSKKYLEQELLQSIKKLRVIHLIFSRVIKLRMLNFRIRWKKKNLEWSERFWS